MLLCNRHGTDFPPVVDVRCDCSDNKHFKCKHGLDLLLNPVQPFYDEFREYITKYTAVDELYVELKAAENKEEKEKKKKKKQRLNAENVKDRFGFV
jgi:predicted metal-binding protein